MTKDKVGITLSLVQTDIASTEPLIYSTRVAPDSTAPDAFAPTVVYALRGMDSKPDPVCWIVVGQQGKGSQ